MYTYTFVTVPVAHGRNETPPYQQMIAEYARQGWRFVQLVVAIPAAIPTEYTLVFERPA